VKEIRQNYRKAVTEGQRLGSGKVVCDNWEKLKVIWGGSPATVTIKNSVTSAQFDDEDEDSLFGAQGDNQFYSENDNDSGDDEHSLGSDNLPKENPQSISQQKTTNPTPKFVDNKRKNMQKNLSAGQRDQVYLDMAKKELVVKQNMVEQLAAATRETNNAFEKMSQSIESVGKSIGDGLLALAGAIGGANRLPSHHPPAANQPQYPQEYYYRQSTPNSHT